MLNSKIVRTCSALAVCAALAPTSFAGIIWDEAASGDLADLNRYAHPDPAQRGSFTDLGPLTPGVNTIRGGCSRTSTSTDGDAVRLTIPSGAQLTEIIFSHSTTAGLREFFRLGAAPGPYFLSRSYPAAAIATGSQDLIQLYGPADGLAGGSYVLSWENLGPAGSTMTYSMDFVVVPAPAAAGPAALAVLFAANRRRRK